MKCAHTFGGTGKCTKCGKRKPGRPKASTKPLAQIPPEGSGQVAAPVAATVPRPGPSGPPDRAARLSALFAPPAAPPPPANDNDGDEPAAKPKGKRSRVGWPWIAKRASTVVDVAAGAAINHWTDRDANDAGEVELEEFETALADYGEDTFGKVEAPAWIVLLLALVFLVLSKYIGAARKPEPKPEPKLEPKPIPALAVAAATSGQGAASDVTAGETATTFPMMTPPIVAMPTEEKGAGNVDAAEIGFWEV